MTKKKYTKQEARIKELERRLMEAEAQLPHKHYFLSHSLEKYTALAGSGLIVTFSILGKGCSEEGSVLIRNGLSVETVRSFQKDIRASWEDSVVFEPKVIKDDETPVQKPK